VNLESRKLEMTFKNKIDQINEQFLKDMHLNQQKKDNFVLKSNHEYDNLMREYNYLTNELQQRYDKTIDEYNGKE